MDTSKHIDRAQKEVARKNYDLAISLFDQILALDPDNGPARTGKRRAELERVRRGQASTSLSAVKNIPHRIAIAVGSLIRMHEMTANQAEKACGNDPANVGLNMILGRALLKAGHKSGAEAAFELVSELDARNIEALKTLGQLCYEAKRWDKALECFERVLKISPRDQVAIKMRKNLAAEGAIKSGGFAQAQSSRDLARSREQMAELEKRQKRVRTVDDLSNDIADLEKRLATESQDPALWAELGQLHLQRRTMKSAVEAFERAVELSPDDYELQVRLGDARLLDLDTRIRQAKQDLADGEEGADDQLRRLIRERKSLRVDEFRRRVAIHPTDTGLRFRLGQYLLDDGHVDDAIAELQIVVKDPKRKHRALTLLGDAFLKKGMGDLARKQYRLALDGLGGVNEKTLGVVYGLARAAEDEGDLEEALDWLVQIYEVDIQYKDVGRRIEELRNKIKS